MRGKKESLPHLRSFAAAVIIMKNINTSEQRLCLIPPCDLFATTKSNTLLVFKNRKVQDGRCAQIMDL